MLTNALEMTYNLTVKGPLPDVRGPLGTKQYWEMSAGRLEGPRIRAEVVMPGSDWMRVGDDGFWRPDVRTPLRTHDGAIILLRYSGLVEQNDAFQRAAQESRETSFDTNYMRMQMSFETGDARYAWLTQRLFVAKGRLLATSQLSYEIYRID